MKQLSGADSMFLQFEHGNNFMHVASLAIYDPSTAHGGRVRFNDVLRQHLKDCVGFHATGASDLSARACPR